jgi:TPP-dependent pyruvate/acetoin dehydrogenase alpha subunit
MDIREAYFQMLRIRAVEEAIVAHYSEQQMRCPVHLSIGQEAVAVGVCAALRADDYAMSGHRSHAHYLAKGGSLRGMLAEIYGKATGCCGGKGGSMHLVDLAAGFLGAVPIVGSTIPIATGAAFASKLRGEARVTVAFFGEGATEEGVFHESLNFAALHKLPIVFVCENNLYSVYSPLSVRQPQNREVFEQAVGHGVESHQADGNDVEAVHRLTDAAARKARTGGGTTFLEFKTYRWREHCGPGYDNDIGYRSVEEYESWRVLCSLDRLQPRLWAEENLSDDAIAQMKAHLDDEIADAFSFAKSSAFPERGAMAKHLFAG